MTLKCKKEENPFLYTKKIRPLHAETFRRGTFEREISRKVDSKL